MKLHELTDENLQEIINERMKKGEEKYAEAHLWRDLTKDIAEELIDAINIAKLFEDRLKRQGMQINGSIQKHIDELICGLEDQITYVMEIASIIPEQYLTDEEGGERVGFREIEAEQEDIEAHKEDALAEVTD